MSIPIGSAEDFWSGYSLLVFVYDKTDDPATTAGVLNVLHTIFIEARLTGDFQTTRGIRRILENDGNEDDLIAFMAERFLPVDEIEARSIAQELLGKKPRQGYLTISNALQWRLQYGRAILKAGEVPGLTRIR